MNISDIEKKLGKSIDCLSADKRDIFKRIIKFLQDKSIEEIDKIYHDLRQMLFRFYPDRYTAAIFLKVLLFYKDSYKLPLFNSVPIEECLAIFAFVNMVKSITYKEPMHESELELFADSDWFIVKSEKLAKKLLKEAKKTKTSSLFIFKYKFVSSLYGCSIYDHLIYNHSKEILNYQINQQDLDRLFYPSINDNISFENGIYKLDEEQKKNLLFLTNVRVNLKKEIFKSDLYEIARSSLELAERMVAMG